MLKNMFNERSPSEIPLWKVNLTEKQKMEVERLAYLNNKHNSEDLYMDKERTAVGGLSDEERGEYDGLLEKYEIVDGYWQPKG